MRVSNTLYKVRPGDTLGTIAGAFTGNQARYGELLMANPQRPKTVVRGQVTFAQNLIPGEMLQIPATWMALGLSAPTRDAYALTKRGPSHGRFLAGEDGGAPPGGTPMTPQPPPTGGIAPHVVHITRDWWGLHGVASVSATGVGRTGLGDPVIDGTAAALVALGGSPLLCTPNLTTLAFQKSYNAALPSGVSSLSEDGEYGPLSATALQSLVAAGTAPAGCSTFGAENAANLATIVQAVLADTTVCAAPNNNVLAFQVCCNKVTGSTLTVDGELGDATAQALAAQLPAGTTTAPSACPQWSLGGGGGTITIPPSGGGTPGVPVSTITSTTTSNSSTTILLGGLALAVVGAAALFLYTRHAAPKTMGHGSPTLGPASHPASTALHPAHHAALRAHHAATRKGRARAAARHARRRR